MNSEEYGIGVNLELGNLKKHLMKIQELMLKLKISGSVDTKGKRL
jgi:hypothetical protein